MAPRKLIVVCAGIALSACDSRPDMDSEREAIRAIDAEMVQAANARDLDTWLSYFADDARMLPPDANVIAGKPAIREFAAELLELPTFSLTHHPPDSINIAPSGDMAYVSYAYELTVSDGQGGAVTDNGKDISIFEKEPDGSWKLKVDMWSHNAPE